MTRRTRSRLTRFTRREVAPVVQAAFPMAGPLVKINGAITFYLENKEK
jgi:hypothetical protein